MRSGPNTRFPQRLTRPLRATLSSFWRGRVPPNPSPHGGEGWRVERRGEAGKLVGSSLALFVLILLGFAACRKTEDEQTVVPFNQDLARKAGNTLPGKTYENREKIRPTMPEKDLLAALGKPTEKLESKGTLLSGRYTYLYADGKLVVTLRGGYVVDVETTFY